MTTATNRKFFVKYLTALLRPMVSFALRHSIKIQDCLEALKEEYIRQTNEELQKHGEVSSTSKISVVTGIHRRDVDRLKERSSPRKFGSDLLSKVIGQWRHDSRFSTKNRPKKLSASGVESEFFALVQSVSKNLNPYTVLFELERAKIVERIGDHIALKAQSLDIAEDMDDALTLLASDMEELSKSVEENITHTVKIPNLHAKTYFDNVSAEYLEDIRKWMLDRGKEFHEEARKYLSQFDIDINKKLKKEKGGVRVSVATFSRIEDGVDGTDQ